MNITITEKAAEEGLHLMNELAVSEKTLAGVYVGIKGGGCAGFQYTVTPMLEDDLGDEYVLFEKNGFKVYTDYTSLAYLDGATIDWEVSPTGKTMVIKNPNATTTCGCGTSFA